MMGFVRAFSYALVVFALGAMPSAASVPSGKTSELPAAASAAARRAVQPVPQPVASPASQQWAQAGGGSIRGSVELVDGPRQSVSAGEVADTVVYFLLKSGGAAPKPQRFAIDTRSKGFTPSVLVVPVGSTVAFENSDTILHNVFSRSGANAFDLGFYGQGQSRERTFTRTGLVVVNCSVHQNMRANVLVLGTPYFARPDAKGRFRIDGVPPGAGTLVIWHPRGAPASIELQGAANVPKQRIVVTKPPLDPHRHERSSR